MVTYGTFATSKMPPSLYPSPPKVAGLLVLVLKSCAATVVCFSSMSPIWVSLTTKGILYVTIGTIIDILEMKVWGEEKGGGTLIRRHFYSKKRSVLGDS